MVRLAGPAIPMRTRSVGVGRILSVLVMGLVLMRPSVHGAASDVQEEAQLFDESKERAGLQVDPELTQEASTRKHYLGGSRRQQKKLRGQEGMVDEEEHQAPTTQRSLQLGGNPSGFWQAILRFFRGLFGGGSTPSTDSPTPPSAMPSSSPSLVPSALPTHQLSSEPSAMPSLGPSSVLSSAPSVSAEPSAIPSLAPSPVLSAPTASAEPSAMPSLALSSVPSSVPSMSPTIRASTEPSAMPSLAPSPVLSAPTASAEPSAMPSLAPSSEPSSVPSLAPTVVASTVPTGSKVPSSAPSLLPSAMPSSRFIIVPPDDGSDCYSSTATAAVTDLVLFLSDPNFDVDVRRVYIFCPETVINVGYFFRTGFFNRLTVEGGEAPFVPLNPNVNIRCGVSGESSNNCIFRGGQEQVLSQADTELLEAVLNLLPLVGSRIPPLNDLPAGYAPDSSNLLIEGFTFEQSADYERDGDDHSPISLLGPGTNMVIRNCIFRNNGSPSAPSRAQSAINLNRFPASQISSPYSSLSIEDSIFEDNTFRDGVITTSFEGSAQENDDPSLIGVTISRCVFSNNVIEGPSPTLAVVQTSLHTTAAVEDSCFIDNTVTGDSSLVDAATVSSLDGIGSYTNLFGLGNTLPASSTCSDIALYTLDGTLTGIDEIECEEFDATSCAVGSADRRSLKHVDT